MKNTLPDTLLRDRLTDVGQYRRMKKVLASSDRPSTVADNEDWKNWDLVPVPAAGSYSTSVDVSANTDTDGATLLKALNKLD